MQNAIYFKRLIEEKDWARLEAELVDSKNEISKYCSFSDKTLYFLDLEIGELKGLDFSPKLPLSNKTFELLLDSFFNEKDFPNLIFGSYTTILKEFSLSESEIIRKINFELSNDLKLIESLGILERHDVILNKLKYNNYKLSPIKKLVEKSDSERVSSYLENKMIFYFDCETTGLNSEKEQMLELYGKLTINGAHIDEISIKFSVDPGRLISESALKVNKIDPYSDEWVLSSISQKEGARKLSEFLEIYTKKGEVIFCAYNAKFDYTFLSSLLVREGYSSSIRFNGMFDPLPLARKMTESKKLVTKVKENGKMCNKLGSIAEGLGISQEGDLHRAKNDVLVLEGIVSGLRGLI